MSWKVVLSPQAETDLAGIYAFIAKENPQKAKSFLDDLVNKIFMLAESRVPGAPREWIRPGLRAVPYRKRCIYFRIEDEKMIVLRILHSAQDISTQFLEKS